MRKHSSIFLRRNSNLYLISIFFVTLPRDQSTTRQVVTLVKMAELSRAKSVHITVTGIILVVLGSGLFGLLYIVHGSSFTLGNSDIFDRKTAFWVAVPVSRRHTSVYGTLPFIAPFSPNTRRESTVNSPLKGEPCVNCHVDLVLLLLD